MGRGEVVGHLSLHFPQQSQNHDGGSQHTGTRGLIPGEPGYLLSFLGCPLWDNNRTGGAWQGGRTRSISRGGGGGGRGAGRDSNKDRRRPSPPEAVSGTVTASGGERVTQTGFRGLERSGGAKSRRATRDPPAPCGHQATEAREDSELGTPTPRRAGPSVPRATGQRSSAALTALCPLSRPRQHPRCSLTRRSRPRKTTIPTERATLRL